MKRERGAEEEGEGGGVEEEEQNVVDILIPSFVQGQATTFFGSSSIVIEHKTPPIRVRSCHCCSSPAEPAR